MRTLDEFKVTMDHVSKFEVVTFVFSQWNAFGTGLNKKSDIKDPERVTEAARDLGAYRWIIKAVSKTDQAYEQETYKTLPLYSSWTAFCEYKSIIRQEL